jgi:signal peptidase II
MPSPNISRAKIAWRIAMAVIAVAVFVGDQATKALVQSRISERAVIPVVHGLFNLTHTKNPGVAFGLFSESPSAGKTALLVIISAGLVVAVVALMLKSQHLPWGTSVGLSLILGGALSNLYDRIRTGLVVDFLDFYFRHYHWPAFNLADSAIVVGAGLVVLQVLLAK